jgi:hypothetical protein
MGSTHFLTKTLAKVRTEMSLHVLRLQPETRHADTRHCGDDESDKDDGNVSAICTSRSTWNAFHGQVMDEAAHNAPIAQGTPNRTAP